MEPMVNIQTLTIHYGSPDRGVHAIDAVDLMLLPGQRFGIVGESGCGKSTLAGAFGRLLPKAARCNAATFRIDGQDILSLEGKRLREFRRDTIAYIFQDPLGALDPTLKIGSHMRLVLAESNDARAHRLAQLGIREPKRVLNSYPHQLSGGMAQRVVIAMALMRNPRVLIADEPTAALDASLRKEIMDLLVTRCEEIGTTLIFVSHDLPLVKRYCHLAGVMYAGRFVEKRSTTALFAAPAHPYTKALLASEPGNEGLGGKLQGLPGMPPALAQPSRDCAFHLRCSDAFELCRSVRPEPRSVPDGEAACLIAGPQTYEARL